MSEETKPNSNWQQQTIEKLALSGLKEQQTARRWSIFFKLLFFAYLLALLFLSFGWIGNAKTSTGNHTALIEIAGVIEAGGDVNADSFMTSLNDAYENKGTKGIILRINSPGGSPVQSGIINEEIKRQKRLHPAIPILMLCSPLQNKPLNVSSFSIKRLPRPSRTTVLNCS